MSDGAPDMGEKKAFMRILTSLAWADGVVDESELSVLHLAANDLSVALSERDLAEQDLEALAAKLEHPDLRARLLTELATLAAADTIVSPEELATIKYFAATWELDPPEIEGVDWEVVGLLPLGEGIKWEEPEDA